MSSKSTPSRNLRRLVQVERLQVRSMSELDALVGTHVMETEPHVYWEDSCTQFRFESLPEALEAMRDPFFSAFTPDEVRQRSSLREVREFPAYSSHLDLAMDVVEHLASAEAPLALWRTFAQWSASFTGEAGVEANTAPVAICLAALRTRGVEVSFEGKVADCAVA